MVLFQLDKPSHVDSNQSEDTKKGLPESCSFKPLQYFITPGGDEEVSLTESRLSGENGQDAPTCLQQGFTSLKSLRDFTHTDTRNTYDIRVYSICKSSSWEPLDITEPMLFEVMTHEKIAEEFMEVVRSCIYKKQPTEEAYCVSWFSKTSSTREEVGYVFKYPELRGRQDSEPWSIRKTCVYSSLDIQTKQSCWVLLHPKYESKAESRLHEHLSKRDKVEQLISGPLKQHVLLISTYLTTWREYLLHYEEELLALSRPIMGTPFAITIPISANTLTRARFIEERLLPLVSIFRSYEKTFSGLLELNDRLLNRESTETQLQMKSTLQNMNNQVAAYTDNVHHLLRKIASMAQLLSDMLALKNQHIAQEQNNQLTKMTQLTVQDSATVRVIGVATLVFLPTTLVATLFSTQFFYLTSSNGLGVSPQVWMLFAASVPFTILTMVWWLVRKRQHQSKRRSIYEGGHTDEEKVK